MKLKLFLLILPMLLNASSALSAVVSSATAANPCPTGFTFSTNAATNKKCCSMNVSCPQGFEISQECSVSGTPATSVNLKFCCVKKVIPFECPPPGQIVMLPPDDCKKMFGVVDPNAPTPYSEKPEKCCFNCAKAGRGFTWIQGSTSLQKCLPVPPNIFFPNSPGSVEGRCCGKETPPPTPTPTEFSCVPPAELIDMGLNNMTADDCEKIYGGQVNPNNIKQCCYTCGKAASMTGATWYSIVTNDSCKPRPPRVFVPLPTTTDRGKCCSRENPTPTPTPTPPAFSCQNATGCLPYLHQDGSYRCYPNGNVNAIPNTCVNPPTYIYMNNGVAQCCTNNPNPAQP